MSRIGEHSRYFVRHCPLQLLCVRYRNTRRHLIRYGHTVVGKETAETVKRRIEYLLDRVGIRAVSSIVTDNGSNFVAAVNQWGAAANSLRCFAHTLQRVRCRAVPATNRNSDDMADLRLFLHACDRRFGIRMIP